VLSAPTHLSALERTPKKNLPIKETSIQENTRKGAVTAPLPKLMTVQSLPEIS